jgi:hypothetical protein
MWIDATSRNDQWTHATSRNDPWSHATSRKRIQNPKSQPKNACRIFVFVLVIAGTSAACLAGDQADPAPHKNVTLMGLLGEWMYPGSKFAGAQMSDGGNRTIPSVKCQSLLTTADPFDKVVSYYEHRFISGPDQREAATKGTPAQSVSSQDHSSNRRVLLRVIVINRAQSSTTLVISQAAGETKTHIAWSHFQNLSAD